MTITKRVQGELVEAVAPADSKLLQKLRKSSSALRAAQRAKTPAEKNKGKAWTPEEHQRFLVALDVFPSGPWKAIADYVGTKDSRQTMTHAQKYRQKHERQMRGLRNKGKKKRNAAKKTTQPQKLEATIDVAMEDTEKATVAMDASFSVAVTGVEISEAAQEDFSMPPPAVTLVKQLSDSPRSAEDSIVTGSDPFAPEVPSDSLFALSLDANTAWLGAKPDAGDLMEILAGFEPEGDVTWPLTWSTNSLEEIISSSSQFDLFAGSGAFV